MLYSLHLSHFIIPESKASLMARWTWGLHSWWAAHITWQAWYLWTDGAARLNSDVCFSAIADAEMILGSESTRGVHLSTVWCFFVTKQIYEFNISIKLVSWVSSRMLILLTFYVHFWVLTWTVCYSDWSHPSPDLEPAAFSQQMRSIGDVSYILFIALGLT